MLTAIRQIKTSDDDELPTRISEKRPNLKYLTSISSRGQTRRERDKEREITRRESRRENDHNSKEGTGDCDETHK